MMKMMNRIFNKEYYKMIVKTVFFYMFLFVFCISNAFCMEDCNIIYGKTTKKQVVEMFGSPDNSTSDTIGYNFDKKTNMYNVYIIENDGTTLNYKLGGGLHRSSVVLFFFDNKNCVSSVSITNN